MIRLTLRTPSPIPLEVPGVTPDHVMTLSRADVERLPVLHGNRSEPLAAFFDVTGDASDGRIAFAGDTRGVKLIGAGMTGGTVTVEGDAGWHAGAKMTGGLLVVHGNVGPWCGAEMSGGRVEVRGSAGDQLGAAYRGSRKGMTGGTIIVHGDAGDEVGLRMRRGLVVVRGKAGEFCAAAMIAGTVFALGGVGRRPAAGMKRGTLVVCGPAPEFAPGFAFACRLRPQFLPLYFGELGGPVPDALRGDVDIYRGDEAELGRGEILHAPAG